MKYLNKEEFYYSSLYFLYGHLLNPYEAYLKDLELDKKLLENK
jgi:hypothetical protein